MTGLEALPGPEALPAGGAVVSPSVEAVFGSTLQTLGIASNAYIVFQNSFEMLECTIMPVIDAAFSRCPPSSEEEYKKDMA